MTRLERLRAVAASLAARVVPKAPECPPRCSCRGRMTAPELEAELGRRVIDRLPSGPDFDRYTTAELAAMYRERIERLAFPYIGSRG